MMKKRTFLKAMGLATAGLSLTPNLTFATPTDRKVRVGIVGGRFGTSFSFHEHPNCIVEAVSDLRQDRRERLMQVYGCSKSYSSLAELLKDPKVEAVFLATPAPDHAAHSLAALRAGKHVLCAVPMAMTVEECAMVKEEVLKTGLTYMMAETSTYMQSTITAKRYFKEGKFGHLFSAAAEYNHPGLEVLWFEGGKPTWRHGLAPMHYPTHCTAFLIAVTGERLTHVSCLGWGDDSPLLKGNPYNNPFWNETAFFQTNLGHPFRVEVNWKGALRSAERAEWRGSRMSLYLPMGHGDRHVKVQVAGELGKDDAGFEHTANRVEDYSPTQWWLTDMLPEALRHNSGHEGSHTFITHEFIQAIVEDRMPEVNVYEALAYTVPGIIAHQSALRNGERLAIPDFDDK
ncbi:Gfo/Idh/MocA family protein [Lunatimonas salinarum]|uniref:Gfo/Idh/MocA family protein n=1 Tax=Lunatimonas salinarum TaxID=1774590 RepID=UPI001FD742E5|nr:Gfo/Idh/MocA family oxidoreductase [Lunatimonas salinarum]